MFGIRKKKIKMENMDGITVSGSDRVYLCLPYDGADTKDQKRAIHEYLGLIKECLGCSVYAPQLSCRVSTGHLADMRRTSLDMMALCDAVIICGNRVSHEMFEEIAYAEHLGLPIYRLARHI